ncbi:hypothetical protein BSL78_25326 [Apostichopus japonicus]|uniref:Uncharacterized protein n=1 Tax=Stichopus japonicus TaxID=307972 RepID=A0A2G8JPZ9_STIJA|nr:hypothetical protein BSL78_25326 [Apostichopus japonicus]
MAKACRRWYNGILRSPSLWRSTEVQLRGNWRDNSEIDYIRYLGQYLKRLTVCGAIRCHRHTKKFQRSVTTIFANLYRQGPVQLNDLTITEFHFQSYFRGTSGAFARAGVIKSMNRFLRQQRKLRAIDLSFNTVTEEEGVSLLSSLANARCVTKLERLNIEEFFKNKERMYVSVEFVHAVTQFINLRLLVINYSCLSNELLCGLGNHANYIGKMERLDVRCSRSDSSDHAIHPSSWQSFKDSFPSVKVHFRLHSLVKLNDLQRILVSQIPLTDLVILGHNDDNFQPDRTLRFVARNYQSVLEKFVIDVSPSYRCYHQSLVTIFKDCTKLNSLELRGRVEWPTLREVFEHLDERYFKRDSCPELDYFRMTVVAQAADSYVEEALIFEEYRDKLYQRRLDYELVVEPQFFPLPVAYNHDEPFAFQMPGEPIFID